MLAGNYRYYEFNSFEGSGKTQILELQEKDGIFTGWLRQSDRYDVVKDFPRNYPVSGKFDSTGTVLVLEFDNIHGEREEFQFREEEGKFLGNYPDENEEWEEWEKIH